MSDPLVVIMIAASIGFAVGYVTAIYRQLRRDALLMAYISEPKRTMERVAILAGRK